MEVTWILAVIIGLVAGYCCYELSKFTSLLSLFMRMIYRADSMSGLDDELNNQPKSLSAATSLYLPQIMKDFPEFHYEEMKSRAQNVLITYLRSIDKQDISVLSEGTQELEDQLLHYIEMLLQREEHEHFESIHIHRMEISNYRKDKGRSSIVFQAALEYFHYVDKNGKLLSGRRDFKEQGKFEVEVCYIQDSELVENKQDAGLALNCPNCGAPLKEMGAKVCKYCGSPVVELNLKVWNFTRVERLI